MPKLSKEGPSLRLVNNPRNHWNHKPWTSIVYPSLMSPHRYKYEQIYFLYWMISKCVFFCHRYILRTWSNVLNTWGIWMGCISCVTRNRWLCTHNVYIIKIHVCIYILCFFFFSHIHCFHEFLHTFSNGSMFGISSLKYALQTPI